jgi:hypothetical protein
MNWTLKILDNMSERATDKSNDKTVQNVANP